MSPWIVFLAFLIVLVVIYGFNVRARWRLRHLPGPQPTWGFGNMLQVGKMGLHNILPQWTKEYGPIYRFMFGRIPIIVVSDPELVAQVCIKKFRQFHDRQYNLVSMGGSNKEAICTMLYGILSARGKYWAGLRASIEPVFHSRQLSVYAPMINTSAIKLAARFSQDLSGSSQASSGTTIGNTEAAADGRAEGSTNSQPQQYVNLGNALASMTLEVIGASAFGVEFDTARADSRIVKEAQFIMTPPKRPNNINRMGPILVPHLGRLWFLISSWMGSEAVRESFIARGYLLGTAQTLMHNVRRQLTGQPLEGSGKLIADTQARSSWLFGDPDLKYYLQAKADAQHVFGNTVPKDHSILYHLARATNKETGQPFTELQAMAQANTMLLAGYETTSTALTFAIIALSRYPEVQAKLLAEVDAFDWQETKGVSFEDISSFPYTRAVVDEAMRMWPPVTSLVGLQREATEAADVGGYHIPQGSKIWIDVMSMHHDPLNFPQPEEFRPDRFLEGSAEAKARHPYAYCPFGIGPRKCVGYRFALEEAVISLAQLYRRFTFELDPEKHPAGQPLQLTSGITLNVKGGAWVRPVPRQAP